MLDIQKVTIEGPVLESIKSLFKAYLLELNEDLCFQSFDSEIDNPLYKYSAPTGALFIATYNATPVGCIALQPLQEAQTCEMKRLYVDPEYRKFGIGDALVKALLQEAQSLGYAIMKLDTLERLQAAIKLYQKFGFETVNAYYDNPLPGVVYMQKEL
jgi:ribosomal protein S18 acetylase RimI-like enzyme